MKKTLIALIILLLLVENACAIYAPRAMGMGGAYTAIADDAFAAYWNPAGFAINPGVEIAGYSLIAQRNQTVGDNLGALKMGFETRVGSPFYWILGVGAASLFALEAAKYLSDRDVVKRGWSRKGKTAKREEAITEEKDEEKDKEKAEKEPAFTRKEIAKKAAEEAIKASVYVAKKFAKAAIEAASRQSRRYRYASPWYRPNYYRPYYWDDRYDYDEPELTPAGKAQFALGLSWLKDENKTLNQDTNWYTLSFATAWEETVSFGGNLNIYDIQEISSGVRGIGAGLDLGALLRFSDKLSLGLNTREILTTDIKWQDNRTPTRYNMEVNAGIAIKPVRQLTIAADVHNFFEQNNLPQSAHYGVEVRPVYGLALRAGLSDGNKTAGMSLGIGQLIVDYTYLGGAYNRTQMVGATWKL